MNKYWHAVSLEKILVELGSKKTGLAGSAVAERLKKFGWNILPHEPPYSRIQWFVSQFNSPLMYIILVTVIIFFLLKHYSDTIFILVVLFINTTVGFYQENKANQSLLALKRMVRIKAKVLRDNQEKEIDSEGLVVGDIVILKAGDKVPPLCRIMSMATNKPKSAYLIFIDDTKRGIDSLTLSDVESKIGGNKVDHLFLVIKSIGGSPFSAVSIMNILDTRFEKISTIMPKYAKSAATLMALGTDEIYMDSKSALGPLDLPIEHHRDGSRISALDVRNTATSMAALVESIAKSRFKFFRDREISTLDSARLFSKKRIFSQLDNV